MSVWQWALSAVDGSSVVVFLLVFLIGYLWLQAAPPRHLPPGPPGLPLIGNILSVRSDMLGQLKKWHQQFGDVYTIRLGNKYFTFINSYKILHETFVKQGYVYSCRPTKMYIAKRVIERTGEGLILSEGLPCKGLRRMALVAMRDCGVGKKTLEQGVQDETRAIKDVLDKQQGEGVALKPLLSKFTANVICSVIFGNRFDYDDPKFIKLTTLANETLRQPLLFSPANVFPLLRFIPSVEKVISATLDNFVSVDKYLETILEDHEDTYDHNDVRNFVDVYIKTRNESAEAHKFTASNMRRVIIDLFFAGTETTSTTVDWLILCMVAYPQVQRLCQLEVDRVIGQNRMVTMDDRKDLPYIEAVITETLRHKSAVPLGVAHRVLRDAKMGCYTIPANSTVMSNISEIHHNPDVWKDPDTFRPERFLDSHGRFCPPKENFVPFAIGPRVCLGEVLARMELFILTTALLQSFHFSMSGGQLPDLEGHLGVTFSAKEQPVLATHR